MRLFIDPGVFNFNILWFQCLLLFLRKERGLLRLGAVLGEAHLGITGHISVLHRIVNLIRLGLSPLELVGVGGLADGKRLHCSSSKCECVWLTYLLAAGFSRISFYICSYWLLMCWKSGTVSFWIGPERIGLAVSSLGQSGEGTYRTAYCGLFRFSLAYALTLNNYKYVCDGTLRKLN